MKILKKNQLAILVIALMLVTAGYLNYTAEGNSVSTSANVLEKDKYAAIGDATLVNSGDLIEENDKQEIMNIIAKVNENLEEADSNENTENTEDTQAAAVEEASKADDYFENSKLEREKMYSQMLETYQKLLESSTISQEQKSISQQEITKINQTKNAIMIAENLITTKGFKDLVIFVNDNSVNVVVKADTLSEDQIAQIQNIVTRELNVDITNVHISNK